MPLKYDKDREEILRLTEMYRDKSQFYVTRIWAWLKCFYLVDIYKEPK